MAVANAGYVRETGKYNTNPAANGGAAGAAAGAINGAKNAGSSAARDTVLDLRGQTPQDILGAFDTVKGSASPASPNQYVEPSSGTPSGGGYYSAPRAQYTAPTLPSATSQEEYIKAMYEANQKAQEEALRASYEKNVGALDYQQSKLAPTYDVAANNAGAQAAIQRAGFNESAAASGLNTGAGSQAELSMRNAEAANISSIRKAQADAQADLDYQRSQLSIEYQNAIREAIAKNELEKAQALYEEAKRVDESLVATAINQANLNWQVWRYNNG